MKAVEPPGDLQLSVLRVLWERGEATVGEVQEALSRTEQRELAPTTIATVLSRMEKKGMVGHRTQGRQFVYAPLLSETDLRHSLVDDLAERLFSGDVGELVCHLLENRSIGAGDIERVKALIAEKERGGKRSGRQ